MSLSLVLGAGSVRGMAHVAVIESLLAAGFRITEIVGTSVGAIVAAFYAAVGLDLHSIREAGRSLRSSHLMAWALMRYAPPSLRGRLRSQCGVIPEHVAYLAEGSFSRMYHGVSRIGIVSWESISQRELVVHNVGPILSLEDAVRGAAALPGLFPPWKCSIGGQACRLVDGGVHDPLPAAALFQPPFQPAQILAVDISASPSRRRKNLARIAALQRQHPDIPIDCLPVDTLNGHTLLYHAAYLDRLLEAGRRAVQDYLSGLPVSLTAGAAGGNTQ